MSKYKLTIFVALFFFLIFTGFVQRDSDRYFKITKSIDIFGRIFKEINLNYVDHVNPEEFMLAGIKGMLSSLDPYTVYLDQDLQKDIDLITKGKYGGIGATVGIQNGRVTVVDLIEGYSAQRQGIRIGDIITKVNDTDISIVNYDDLGKYLKKEPGEEVIIQIERDGFDEEIIFNLVCEEIEIKNVTYFGFVPAESNNAYIKLSGFSRTAGKEVKNAIRDLQAQKEILSIILDLRGNPGGLLDAAIDVSEKFLKNKEVIVTVKGRDEDRVKTYKSKEEPVAGDIPMIVLVNGGTASASEIVAGAIQDHDRGIILGSTSYGKGLVQTVVPLSYNTSLKITTAKYFTPSGRSIQKVDYFYNNDVLEEAGKLIKQEFATDNFRKVLSAGGIEPDTAISSSSESEIIQTLLAKGTFFKFTTNFYNTNPAIDFTSVKSENLISAFNIYIEKEDYQFTTKAEGLLKQLKEITEAEDYSDTFEQMVKDICTNYQDMKKDELKRYEADIIAEIRQELAARVDGRNGRIKESLKYDKQFDVALSILNDKTNYKLILTVRD